MKSVLLMTGDVLRRDADAISLLFLSFSPQLQVCYLFSCLLFVCLQVPRRCFPLKLFELDGSDSQVNQSIYHGVQGCWGREGIMLFSF